MLDIIDKTRNHKLSSYKKDVQKYYKKAIKYLGLPKNANVSLILCGSNTIKRLNKKYRNINKVTDVLSFEEYDDNDDSLYLGEIFINVDRVKSQAKKYKHSIKREFVFLTIHGLLHLCGYDHTKNKKEEKRMFDIQDYIVGDLK